MPLNTARSKLRFVMPRWLPWKILLGLGLAWGITLALLVPWGIRHSLQPGRLLPAGIELRIGTIRFNPYTLRLDLRQLSLDRSSGRHLADVARIDARLSWRTLWYRLPIIARLRIIQPHLILQRLSSGQLDVADLLDPLLAPSSTPMPRFAIANIELTDGRVDLDDLLLKRQHRLDQWQLAIPLLATVSAHGEPEVSPRLDLRMDGAPLHVDAVAEPFGEHLRTRARLQLSNADLPAYLPYLPVQLPLGLATGKLSGDLQLNYDAGSQPTRLQMQGHLQLRQVQLQSPGGQRIVDLTAADIELADLAPLEARYHFGKIQLSQPSLHLQLDAAGHIGWLDALLAGTPTPRTSQPGKSNASSPPLDLQINAIRLDQGQLDIRRAGISNPVQLSELQLAVDQLSSKAGSSSPLQLSAQLTSGGHINLDGQLQWQQQAFAGQLQANQLRLAPWLAWLPPAWRSSLQLDGRLDSQLKFHIENQPSLNLQLDSSKLALYDVKLQHPGSSPLQWRRLDLQLDALDLARRRLQLGTVHWQGLQLTARRQQGSLDLLQGWPDLGLTSVHPARTKAIAIAPWRWQLGQLQVEQAQLQLQQQSDPSAEPLQLNILQLQLQHLSSEAGNQGQLKLDAMTGHRGTIQAAGAIGLSPLSAQLTLQVDHVDLAPVQPLIPIPLHIRIRSARLGGKGRLQYEQGQQLAFQGDARLNHVQIEDVINGGDLLHWSHLQVDGLQLRQHRGQTRIDIGQIGLANFYARLIVHPDGHTNLQQLLAAPNQVLTTTSLATAGPASAAGSAQGGVTSVPTLQVSASLPMQLHVGGVHLRQGQLNYSDNFIKPNFNADITELQGQIGSFGNIGGAPADLALTGALDHRSPVLIKGKIDPLALTAFADITGTANSVPLPNLSAYSSRYTGYPITSGLLNADVHYLLKDDTLKAENHLLIDQLTFGPAVTTPGAAHLPVKLAIALLKNSRGEIDIRLPVSGSLSDPRFSISDLFWHAMRDLIGRAITSPFRLLASAFGNSHDQKSLEQIQFAPGLARLDDTAVAQLQKLVAMLQQRPSLNLDVTGRFDADADTRGLREHWVDAEVRAEYHLQHIDASGPMPTLSIDDYHRLLVKVYHHAHFSKPKNLIGLEKTPSDAEMTAAIREHAEIKSEQLADLASQRALAVARWLHGKIDDSRVLLHVPQIATGNDSHSAAKPDTGPATRVDLGLH